MHKVILALLTLITASMLVGCNKPAKNIELDDFENAEWSIVDSGFSQASLPAALPAQENITVMPSLPAKSREVVEIKEKMFMTQVSDVYVNTEDYLGKTIKLEGIFKTEQYHAWDPPYCYVLRYGPGCCGYDGNVGFEIKWTKNFPGSYPNDDAWIEVMGELKYYEGEYDFGQYLYLDLTSLNVLERRGLEFVVQ